MEDLLVVDASTPGHPITDAVQEESEFEFDDNDDTRPESHTLTLTFSPWHLLYRVAINLVLPFVNGVMIGIGEILAHEVGFRWGWAGARVVPASRTHRRNVGL